MCRPSRYSSPAACSLQCQPRIRYGSLMNCFLRYQLKRIKALYPRVTLIGIHLHHQICFIHRIVSLLQMWVAWVCESDTVLFLIMIVGAYSACRDCIAPKGNMLESTGRFEGFHSCGILAASLAAVWRISWAAPCWPFHGACAIYGH